MSYIKHVSTLRGKSLEHILLVYPEYFATCSPRCLALPRTQCYFPLSKMCMSFWLFRFHSHTYVRLPLAGAFVEYLLLKIDSS